MVTKQAIADYLGVSRTTVSLVLNNAKNNTISEKTREKVIKAAKELGYRSNDSLNKICFILYNRPYDDPRYLLDLRNIEERCSKNDYSMIFMSVKSNEQDFEKLREFLNSDEADGIIITGDVDNVVINILNSGSVPFVIYGGMERNDKNIILPDSEKISYEAIKYMLDFGHKRIALFLGTLNLLIHRQIVAGYEKALLEYGVEIDKSLIQASKEEDGYEMAERMKVLNIPYSAVFCANTIVQFTALQWYKENKICIPEDKSIVGYGLSNVVKLSVPELTTFYFDYAKSAEIVVNTLLKIIAGESVETGVIYLSDIKMNEGKTLLPKM